MVFLSLISFLLAMLAQLHSGQIRVATFCFTESVRSLPLSLLCFVPSLSLRATAHLLVLYPYFPVPPPLNPFPVHPLPFRGPFAQKLHCI